MKFNPNPPNWKIIIAVILILLTDLYQALILLGRLPQTPYEVLTIVLHALILVFLFLDTGENPI